MEDSPSRGVDFEEGAAGPEPSETSDAANLQDLITADEVYYSDSDDAAPQAGADADADVQGAEQAEHQYDEVDPDAYAEGFEEGADGLVCRRRQRNRRRASRVHHYHHHHCPSQDCAEHQELLASHARLESQVAGLRESHRQLADFVHTSVGLISGNLIEVAGALTELAARPRAGGRARYHRSPSPPHSRRRPSPGPSRWEPVEVVSSLRELRERAHTSRRSPSPFRRPSAPAPWDATETAPNQPAATVAPAASAPVSSDSSALFASPPGSPSSLSARIAADFDRFPYRVRRNTRSYFIFQFVCVRELYPLLSAEEGWNRFVARVIGAGPYVTPDQVDRAWTLAFERPTQAHFRRLWETPLPTLRAALPDPRGSRHGDLIRF